MKTLLGFLAAIVLVATAGCSGNSKEREAAAFRRGQQNALEAQSAKDPSVFVRGMVRNPRVPWHENLTLSQALAAAQYTGALDPWQIKVIRQGQVYKVDPKRLLRGQEDPLLEPGDLIEIPR